MTVLSFDILTFHGTLKQSNIGNFPSPMENDGKSIATLDLHRSDQSVSDQKIPNMSLPENGIAILGLYNVIINILTLMTEHILYIFKNT